ncbi:hypothetical protein COC69_30925 [Bacillus cereus]|uniref:ADP ribosyltransferase domain-containing protein n=1 Tax=Bacillus cereus TaxID=1396 RepID=A0A9X7GST2_BACCE|nr:hypothetical protein COC69_30925 [Bacillus cereus]
MGKTVNEKELNAFNEYASGNSREINGYLRDNKGGIEKNPNPELNEFIFHLDNSLERAKVPSLLKVYRRLPEIAYDFNRKLQNGNKINREAFNEFNKQNSGRIITDDAYISTTLFKDASIGFI